MNQPKLPQADPKPVKHKTPRLFLEELEQRIAPSHLGGNGNAYGHTKGTGNPHAPLLSTLALGE